MGLFDQWGGAKAPDPANMPSLTDYANQAKGGLTTATGMQILQNAAMRNQMDMMNRTVTGVEMNDPKEMHFALREISNGYMVKVNNDETYVKDLNDVGGVIVARWAAKILGE